jgi:hypothetical protein
MSQRANGLRDEFFLCKRNASTSTRASLNAGRSYWLLRVRLGRPKSLQTPSDTDLQLLLSLASFFNTVVPSVIRKYLIHSFLHRLEIGFVWRYFTFL